MPYDTQRFFPSPRPATNNPQPTAKRITEAQEVALRPGIDEVPGRVGTAPPYPESRDRPRGAYPSTVEKYERYEELAGLAGTGAQFIEVGTFSGYPDSIDLLATGGDALVSLRDATGREESALRLVANVPRETHISRRKVFATNVSDGSPATVRATGKWAEPYNGDTE